MGSKLPGKLLQILLAGTPSVFESLEVSLESGLTHCCLKSKASQFLSQSMGGQQPCHTLCTATPSCQDTRPPQTVGCASWVVTLGSSVWAALRVACKSKESESCMHEQREDSKSFAWDSLDLCSLWSCKKSACCPPRDLSMATSDGIHDRASHERLQLGHWKLSN